MDVLANVLDEVRARGALFRRALLDPPWSLRFETGAPLTLVSMLRGRAWVVPPAGEPAPLGPGDVAVLTGPAPYTVADDPATPPRQVVTVEDYCAESREMVPLGPRTCGTAPDAAALLLGGAYAGRAEIGERLLRALPGLLVVPADGFRSPALDLVAAEAAVERPGQQVVLDRLLDLILVETLRAWFELRPGRAPVWYRSPGDPVVDHALRLLHEDPAHPWTVRELAAAAGVSRAAFARRFTARVGEPPMTYLAGWRVALAADLLRSTDATVGSIARRVGYSGAFALSVAFKRLRGVSPTEHRAGT
ncbi:AraC family transcriptional regulator [Streptomyces litchfieldiae]|uniref:AraC family transcriptional regulator n=1 Tax=Streptomyces litchfieldiae TaxID=3075543 RepID=A0ABU2MMB9_9ACTN|nr:AraC family transcriptional regulator [Streptomyces sp. DSM 44938]MDT0342269.1 AraC family transcriptional regulator [Streptomyces sp. DSM 44938]